MLTSFTPVTGPNATIEWTLPITNTAPIAQPSFRDTAAAIGRGVGGFPHSGTGPAFLGPVVIDATFIIYERWCSLNGYGTGAKAIMSAMYDFNLYVMQGGLGTLKSTPPANTTRGGGIAADTITYRSTSARVIGSPVILYSDGGTRATVEVQFECPTGLWTNTGVAHGGGGSITTDYIVDA